MILVLGDLHLRLYERYSRRVGGSDLRLEMKFSVLEGLAQQAIAEQAEAFILLGDVFERVNPPEMLRYRLMHQVIHPLAVAGIPTHVIMGNHDTNFDVWSLMSEESVTAYLILHKLLSEVQINDWKFLVAPWGTEPEEIYTYNGDAEVLLAHMDVVGASIGGITLQRGVHPARLAGQFKLSIFGHIHGFQEFDGNITLLGSLTRDDRGEAQKIKYLGLLCRHETDQTPRLRLKVVSDWDYATVQSENIPETLKGKVVTLKYRLSDRGRINTLRKLCYDRGAEFVILEGIRDVAVVGEVEAPSQDSIRIVVEEYAKKNDLDAQVGLGLLAHGGTVCE